jgi:ectoine hydroxylase-related dioxygenase (phytanoyl-CoA dioxygenase family)
MAMELMEKIEAFKDSFSLLNKPELLRKRANEEGYLYIKKLIEPEEVLQVRFDILSIAKKFGMLKPNSNLMDGIANPEMTYMEGKGDWKEYYAEVQSCRSFHQLSHNKNIVKLFENLFGTKVLVHPRNISRTIFPNITKYTTPPHQDFLYIKGTPNTWTVWTPVGDCPEDLGGLAVSPGSHKLGMLDVRKADGAGGYACNNSPDTKWVYNETACGDVVMFHSYTIHQGRDNSTADKIRLSFDFRYQPLNEDVHESSLEPHCAIKPWEDLYRNWPKNDALQYYWVTSGQ